jgi:UDP-N-acetylglucosamine:LPS N-acetylglucosamine transferase
MSFESHASARDDAAEGDDADRAAPGPILFVGSSGGHLAQLLALRAWWQDRERVWVTFPTADALSSLAEEELIEAHYPTTRNVKNLVLNGFLAARVLLRRRPSVIVTTGAGVALPFFVVGRLLRIPTVYIEVFDRMDTRTLTARLCRPFTTQFVVQWKEQLDLYPDAALTGPLL